MSSKPQIESEVSLCDPRPYADLQSLCGLLVSWLCPELKNKATSYSWRPVREWEVGGGEVGLQKPGVHIK